MKTTETYFFSHGINGGKILNDLAINGMPAIVDGSFIEHAICKYYPRCCGGWGGGAALNTFKFLWNGLEKHKNVVIHLADFHFMKENFNPIQDRRGWEGGCGGGQKVPVFPL